MNDKKNGAAKRVFMLENNMIFFNMFTSVLLESVLVPQARKLFEIM
jgi:hypothetical protein